MLHSNGHRSVPSVSDRASPRRAERLPPPLPDVRQRNGRDLPSRKVSRGLNAPVPMLLDLARMTTLDLLIDVSVNGVLSKSATKEDGSPAVDRPASSRCAYLWA